MHQVLCSIPSTLQKFKVMLKFVALKKRVAEDLQRTTGDQKWKGTEMAETVKDNRRFQRL